MHRRKAQNNLWWITKFSFQTALYLLKKHGVFHISESLPTFIFASLWLSTLKNIISKSTFSILISIHLLWYYKENLLQNQDMVSMVITSSTLSSDEAIQQLLYSQAKLDTLLCWSLKELCNKIYQKFKQWKPLPNWVKHKK